MIELETRRATKYIYVVGSHRDPNSSEILLSLPVSDDYSIHLIPNIAAFVQSFHGMTPGCVLLEIDAVQLIDLALARSKLTVAPPMSLILIGDQIGVTTVIEAMKLAFVYFLERPFDTSHVIATLVEGFKGLDRQSRAMASERIGADRIASLTPREREVFAGLIKGLSNKEIAQDLSISHRTVEVYRASLAVKLNSKKPTDWVRLELGLAAKSTA